MRIASCAKCISKQIPVEDAQASEECVDCGCKLCSGHSFVHKKKTKHKMQPISGEDAIPMCIEHNSPKNMVCLNCKEFICITCKFSMVHEKHDVKLMDKKLEEIEKPIYEKNIRNIKPESVNRCLNVLTTQKLEFALESIPPCQHEIETEIKNYVEELKKQLDDKQVELLTQVKEVYYSKKRVFSTLLEIHKYCSSANAQNMNDLSLYDVYKNTWEFRNKSWGVDILNSSKFCEFGENVKTYVDADFKQSMNRFKLNVVIDISKFATNSEQFLNFALSIVYSSRTVNFTLDGKQFRLSYYNYETTLASYDTTKKTYIEFNGVMLGKVWNQGKLQNK